jgi:hypothetical protein
MPYGLWDDVYVRTRRSADAATLLCQPHGAHILPITLAAGCKPVVNSTGSASGNRLNDLEVLGMLNRSRRFDLRATEVAPHAGNSSADAPAESL